MLIIIYFIKLVNFLIFFHIILVSKFNIYVNGVISMDNNLNENMMNNIKNMVDNGDISSAISQISPEMINNFSKMLSNARRKF